MTLAGCRRRVLDTIRGANSLGNKTVPTPVFPLERHHLASLYPLYQQPGPCHRPLDPADFHSILCQKIEQASKRVYLASLYVGPAVDPKAHRQEDRLLQALRTCVRQGRNPNVDVKILLDKSRGLRPVPRKDSSTSGSSSSKSNATITSAEACRKALSACSTGNNQSSASVYLHSVLSPLTGLLIPNPLDEVAGVFHIKAYIMDDDLILSGANLSEEYFTDRHDRYLHVLEGGNGLVDWYASLVRIICHYSQTYHGENQPLGPAKPRGELVQAVRSHFDASSTNESLLSSHCTESVIAWACPTFQFPQQYGTAYRSDSTVLKELLGSCDDPKEPLSLPNTLRVASAYLNPTASLQHAWQSMKRVHCVTAGFQSHGFRPKKKAGNKGRSWIPAVFDKLARKLPTLPYVDYSVTVSYFSREGWTFHAKGLWLSRASKEKVESVEPSFGYQNDDSNGNGIEDEEDLICVTHGSGNYGERSEYRDMESNLYLVLPAESPLIPLYKKEWNSMCEYATPVEKAPVQNVPWYIGMSLPFIRKFF